MTQIMLTGMNLSDLLEKIGQVVKKELDKVLHNDEKPKATKYLTRKEVANLVNVTLPTLNEWTKLGWLQSYKIGSRVLYKESEIMASIEKLATFKFKKGGYHGA